MSEQATLQKALYTIKKLKHLLQTQQTNAFEPIAIVGLSCRFPQAVGKEAYWEMLKQGRNVITKIPNKRWELLKDSDEILRRDPDHPYWGGFMDNIADFDAYFFGISPREAIRIDPQHRLLLEVAHEAIEDAGIPVDSLAGTKTGVFASLYVSQLAHSQQMDTEMDALYLPTGNAMSIAANRISYLFDLRGPSVVVDSACSSSMTSLHLACLNLQNKTCDLALVGGAKLNLLPYINFVLTKGKMLSPDGQCKTFDAEANGYVQGEGVGVIVLKPLVKAIKDNDRIYAVITGSALNQDGRTNGLTAPNGLQQEALLKAAYQTANIQPEDISYIECHGTGTFLGDPIELQALGEVVGKKRDSEKPCWIGSVKTNIGHLEYAAGIASIIKVALALKHGEIPAHLNFNQPNPHIAFDKYNLRVPKKMQPWPKYGDFRIAGISGFGFGGSNAHLVMRELSETEKSLIASTSDQTKPELFTLSAKNIWALNELIARWSTLLQSNSSLTLAEVCYNTHVKRMHYTHRLAIIANSVPELINYLKLLQTDETKNVDNIFRSNNNNKKNHQTVSENLASMDLKTLATLYVSNANINWQKYEENRNYPLIDMPLYPWQHKEYWPPLGHPNKHMLESSMDIHPLQGRQIFSPLPQLQFEFKVSTTLIPDLKDTYNILHAGYYLEIMAFAVAKMSSQSFFTIEDHQFLSPVIVPNNNHISVQLILTEDEEKNYQFDFYSRVNEQQNWIKNACGKLIIREPLINSKINETIETIKARCTLNEPAELLYEKVIAMGMPAGESIRWTHQYWLGEKEILCEFRQPVSTSNNEKYLLKIHPSIFDACIQPLFKLLPNDLTRPYIASSAEKLHFLGLQNGALYLWGKLKEISVNGDKIIGDCCLINERGQIISYLENISLTQLDNKIQIEELMKSKAEFTVNLSNLNLAERKKHIALFLIEQIAIIFSIPKHDIHLDLSLRDLGIDSLMALVLMRAIEVGLEKSYSMQELMEGPSITALVDYLAGVDPSAQKTKSSHWIAYRKRQEQAQLRLFCFPYGGGGASIYRDWQQDMPDFIEVCPIQLPGREERLNELPINNLSTLIAELIENLPVEFDLPFAFFGHSFGSLIAFELARHLRTQQLPMPTHLFVSAFPDPRVPTKSLDKLLSQLKSVNLKLSDIDHSEAIAALTQEKLNLLSEIFNENGIMGYGDYLLDKEIMKVLLPIFMGDMGIVKSYQYYQAPPLALPITVFAGRQDAWVSYEDHLEWKIHTEKDCEFVVFDGGHMFIKDPQFKKEMQSKIVALVSGVVHSELST